MKIKKILLIFLAIIIFTLICCGTTQAGFAEASEIHSFNIIEKIVIVLKYTFNSIWAIGAYVFF